ncbi:MAG: DNA polymerase IV [Candidatus Margulisbacteria bacterium]|nr:DNA polymerase IV [Candidatus Margulisiibacteriota bacterium]
MKKTIQPLTLISWPNTIVHIDGDSFFASVEQALDPSLKGKAIVTGQERGIASAISVEGKKLGIKRGMPIGLIKRNYPDCVIVPGNYEAYMTFAKRIFDIMRRYTPAVEEYSIDEAFADITGLRRTLNKSYKDIASGMQKEITAELDITVSVGVSLTKTLAKLCSKFRKPNGLTCVKGSYIHILLQKNSIEKVWGIGHNIAAFLKKYDCHTAYDFAQKPLAFVEEYLTKKEVEIYKELRGEMVYPVEVSKKETYQSISKAKTFGPTSDKAKVFAQLIKNIEEATAKCRKYKLMAGQLIIVLKTQQFRTAGLKAKLSRFSASPLEIIPIAEELFKRCYADGNTYRQTICILTHLTAAKNIQLTLFDSGLSIEKLESISESMDEINKKYGRGTIHLTESLAARHKYENEFRVPLMKMNI